MHRIRTAGCFFLFSVLLIQAQNAVMLELDKPGKDRYFEASKLVAPVFRLKDHHIESYEKFGVKSDHKTVSYPVKLPEINSAIDTGYTFLYSGTNPENKTGYTPVLVLNYSRRLKPAVLYIDRNLNYDFTDDGSPDTFYLNLHHLDIELKNPRNSLQSVTVRISRFDMTRDHSFKSMVDQFYSRYSETREYAGTDFSFREQRFNIRCQHYAQEGDSFRISLMDANYNGLYNEPGIDKIILDNGAEELIPDDHSFSITPQLKDCYFERKLKSFRVTALDSFGRSISFFHDTSHTASRQLVNGKKVPKIIFRDVSNRKIKLHSYRRTPVYIFFWNSENPGFQEDTAALRKIHEKFCREIMVIALNYGDNPVLVKSYALSGNICWMNGIATKKTIREFQLENVPYSFLLGKRRKLLRKDLSPSGLLEALEKGEAVFK
jgi:hypothetical protein